jgi:hypothetical protein
MFMSKLRFNQGSMRENTVLCPSEEHISFLSSANLARGG